MKDMNLATKKLLSLKKETKGYFSKRILAEMEYLMWLGKTGDDALLPDLAEAIDELYQHFSEENAITKAAALEAEKSLMAYSAAAKKLHLICISHAHIDMDWQWGIDETCGVVLDTFETMLKLLDEYPQFIFSQSQAAVYNIVETYCPSMLKDIQKRVHEGRWEINASTWVENDKNMSGTEAMVRHLIYSREYLKKLFGEDYIPPEIDFEPDTFGHSAYLPGVLSAGGIKYYYHSRGNEKRRAYRWRVPSGEEILVYCEPHWYMTDISADMAAFVPLWCKENSTDTAIRLYGVGDHGGGPTRRDIERILDMQTWSLMPDIRFGSLREFFHTLEKAREKLPVEEGEQNFIFAGCYTSQSRIKQANRFGEDHLYDSEALSAMSILAGAPRESQNGFVDGWKKVLFNQFHDILPGSCVREARECALGSYREANAYALGNAKKAMRDIAQKIDTSIYGVKVDTATTALGAGDGYNAAKASGLERAFAETSFGFSGMERGSGSLRAYTLFNSTQYQRRETVILTVWDLNLSLYEMVLKDGFGREVPFEIIEGEKDYWHHKFIKIAFTAEVPSFGYTNYYVMEAEKRDITLKKGNEPRKIFRGDDGYILQNNKIRAEFEPETLRLISLWDKENKKELLSAFSGFDLVYEADNEMSSWTMGDSIKSCDLNKTCRVNVTDVRVGESFSFQSLSYEIKFGNSLLKVHFFLGNDDPQLRLSLNIDFQETGNKNGIPQLRLRLPYSYKPQGIRYDVPGGSLVRGELKHDVPSIRYAAPIPENGPVLVLTSDCKYGYRASENTMYITLIRASRHPDPYPEQGIHQVEIGIGVALSSDWKTLGEMGMRFSHPIYVYSNSLHKGTLGQSMSLLKIEGNAETLSLKPGENDGVVLRLANWGEQKEQVSVITANPSNQVCLTDYYEKEDTPVSQKEEKITLDIGQGQIQNLHLLQKE